MLSIAIFSDQLEDVATLKTLIQDYLIENKAMAKISVFQNPEDLIIIPSTYDVYFMDMDSESNATLLGKKMKQIDSNSQYVYTSINPNMAQVATKARCDYFITKPYDQEEIAEILTDIRREIKEDSIIIKIPSGDRRIRINNLNYINIVRRCLCYHLKDGAMFDGQTLRSSFEKAIDPLQKHKSFLFLSPSLLINLGEIKILNKDNIIFENDDVLFFPMKQYDTVKNAWVNYNRIIE